MIFSIDIFDSHTAGLIQCVEHTQIHAPRLVYSGAEKVYTPIMASQLAFNMLAVNADDGAFLHLFTGGETKYKVVLYDATDENNLIVLWQGFLLPDQYAEPYKAAQFFVSFVATDRLGQLKSVYLPETMYTKKINIAYLLGYILNLTGVEFPIYYAPAIVHALENDITLKWLEIDLAQYKKTNSYTDVYTILTNLLKSLQVTLFQEHGVWYIIGVNRWADVYLV